VTEDHLEFQRTFYDRHFAKREAAVREQLAHPLFRSFNDRVAAQVLDLGLPASSTAGAPSGPKRTVRVFEPGCGDGLLGSALERAAQARGLELAYTGSDLSSAALELAGTVVSGDFRVGDGTDVADALPPASQDIVVAKNLLHHLDDPAGFLRAAARALVPGGRVIAFEPLLGCPQFLLFNVLAARREQHYFKGQRRNREAFRRAGFGSAEFRRFSWLPYELAFVIRPSLFRRLFSTANPATIRRVSDLDDRLTAKVPWLACYAVWVATPDGAGASGTNGSNRM
jgi:SAM-dependent methyltransferase